MSDNPWDSKTQQFHGGQDWRHLKQFVEDFSVTTNGLGTPKKALEAARLAVDTIHHYPPADFEPAISDLAKFLWPNDWEKYRGLLDLGNGASELIDLVIRTSGVTGKWRPSPSDAQYKEYERSARAAGLCDSSPDDRSAKLICIVNPTNPTGNYMGVEEVKAHIEQIADPGTTILVDESMQLWVGPHWRQDSLIHQRDWVRALSVERNIHVWIITSWTKIWSCTGVRLGSVISPTQELLEEIKRKQVPWSVNSMALAFLSEVVTDNEYMQQTWELTPQWNTFLREGLLEIFPNCQIYGGTYLSWIWVDLMDEMVAAEAVRVSKEFGVPIRSGKPGYSLPTFVRIAARPQEPTQVLLNALRLVNNASQAK